MKYMLDTNICIYLIRRKPPRVIHRMQSLRISDICLSSITLSELEYGVEKSQRPEQNRWALMEFLAPIDILPFDDGAARSYGALRNRLERAGKTIGAMDMLIASHALSLGIVLVTNNVREFHRVENLSVENWV